MSKAFDTFRSRLSDLRAAVEKQQSAEPVRLELKDTYGVQELLRYHDKTFVRCAYQALLRREPDVEGYRHFLKGLREGKATKLEILRSIASSAEAVAVGVRVMGLDTLVEADKWSRRIERRLPLVASLIDRARTIAQRDEVFAEAREIERGMYAALHAHRDEMLAEMRRVVEEQNKKLSALANAIDATVAEVDSVLGEYLAVGGEVRPLSAHETHFLDASLPIAIAALPDKRRDQVLYVGERAPVWLRAFGDAGCRARAIASARSLDVFEAGSFSAIVINAAVAEFQKTLRSLAALTSPSGVAVLALSDPELAESEFVSASNAAGFAGARIVRLDDRSYLGCATR